MKGLADRVFLVTGGGSGIGRGACERLAEAGARVAVVDCDADRADAVAGALGAGGFRALALACDVTDEAAVADMVRRVVSDLGPLRGAVTSAGVNIEADRQPLEEASLEAFRRVLDVNLVGTFLVAKHVIPKLVAGGGGSFVSVSSTAGIRGGTGHGFGYTASKGGVVALTEHLAVRCGGDGVRVNCLCPGATAGEGMGAFFRETEGEAWVAPQIPMGRVGQAEEVGAVAAYLLSEDAAYITGQTVAADGGATAR